MPWRLQPHVAGAATVSGGGCHPLVVGGLQPYVFLMGPLQARTHDPPASHCAGGARGGGGSGGGGAG